MVEPLSLEISSTTETSRCISVEIQIMHIGCIWVNEKGATIPVGNKGLPPGNVCRASEFRRMWWWSRWALVLRLIRRRRNRRPAGSARAAKLNRPISESSFRLVVLRGAEQRSSSARIS